MSIPALLTHWEVKVGQDYGNGFQTRMILLLKRLDLLVLQAIQINQEFYLIPLAMVPGALLALMIQIAVPDGQILLVKTQNQELKITDQICSKQIAIHQFKILMLQTVLMIQILESQNSNPENLGRV